MLTRTGSRVLGTGIAWRMRNQSKSDFLNGNRTQTGQDRMPSRPQRRGLPDSLLPEEGPGSGGRAILTFTPFSRRG